MSQDQGTTIDTSYIDGLTKQVEDIDVCADLQKFIDEGIAEIKKQLSGAEDSVSFLKPIADLLESPEADLAKIVTWISDFITGVLKPMYQPYLTYAEQVAAMAEAVIKLEAAVISKAAQIESCIISLPSAVIPSTISGSTTGE